MEGKSEAATPLPFSPSLPLPLGPSPSRAVALGQAVLVTFLWSTSWVLIKIGLVELPPLSFAGLRYALAALLLAPLALFHLRRQAQSRAGLLAAASWPTLAGLGLLVYSVTQGAQFAALVYLPAITASLVLSFTPALVALLSAARMGEIPSRLQWVGLGLALLGAAVYFPIDWSAAHPLGLIIIGLGLVANAGSVLWTRGLMRGQNLAALPLTAGSMLFGSVALLGTGLLLEGLPRLSLAGMAIIAWLAVVNTAFAWTLWNHALRVLPAFESSVINNTMTVQIAVLAWLFLGERLTPVKLAGLALVVTGVLLVQFHEIMGKGLRRLKTCGRVVS